MVPASFRECLDELRTTPSERLREDVLSKLGDMEAHVGNVLEAKALLNEVKGIALRLQDRLRIAANTHSLAWLAHNKGKLDEAIELFEQAAEMFMAEYQVRNPTTEIAAIERTGGLLQQQVDCAKAQSRSRSVRSPASKTPLFGFAVPTAKMTDCRVVPPCSRRSLLRPSGRKAPSALMSRCALRSREYDLIWICQCLDLDGRLKFTLGDENGAMERFATALTLMRKDGKSEQLMATWGK